MANEPPQNLARKRMGLIHFGVRPRPLPRLVASSLSPQDVFLLGGRCCRFVSRACVPHLRTKSVHYISHRQRERQIADFVLLVLPVYIGATYTLRLLFSIPLHRENDRRLQDSGSAAEYHRSACWPATFLCGEWASVVYITGLHIFPQATHSLSGAPVLCTHHASLAFLRDYM